MIEPLLQSPQFQMVLKYQYFVVFFQGSLSIHLVGFSRYKADKLSLKDPFHI